MALSDQPVLRKAPHHHWSPHCCSTRNEERHSHTGTDVSFAPSDVLGRASSPEPAEPSPFKPKPSRALTRACSGLGLGFRFQKPEPEAQARALIHCGSMPYDQKGNIITMKV